MSRVRIENVNAFSITVVVDLAFVVRYMREVHIVLQKRQVEQESNTF